MKTFTILVAASLLLTSATAQTKSNCAANKTQKVVTSEKRGYRGPYNASAYAENYKVVRSYCGYTIAGETPSDLNTEPKTCARQMTGDETPAAQAQTTGNSGNPTQAPQSQSYPAGTANK